MGSVRPSVSRSVSLVLSLLLASALSLGVATAGWPEAGGPDAPPDPQGGTGGDPLAGSLSVRVVAAGGTDPIVGAFVMVGPAEGDPFAGNVGLTDANGEIAFSDPSLAGTISVTAGAPGRAYVTVFDLGVDQVVMPLRPIDPPPSSRLGDQFLGIEVNNGIFCSGDTNLDFGFVLPAFPIDEVLSGGAGLTLSTTTEPLTTPDGEMPVPSNMYMPRQCEVFEYYEKEFYHLRVSNGRRSLFGLSARVSIFSFLDATSIIDFLDALNFREMDILRDREVFQDSEDFDLVADLPLAENLTVNIDNAQPATLVLATAGGRLPTPEGGEEVIVTGLAAFDPDEDGSLSATLSATTVPATGELGDMTHVAFVAQSRDDIDVGNGSGNSTAFRRSGFTPPATLTFDSFFDIVVIESPDDQAYSWTDVVSPASPSDRHLNTSSLDYLIRVPNPDDPTGEITETHHYWTLYTRGIDLDLVLPVLPASAPVTLPDPDANLDQDRLDLGHAVQYLGEAPGFDYDHFAFTDPGRYATHISNNGRALRCDTISEAGGVDVAPGPNPGEVTVSWGGSGDMCHDTNSDRRWEVYASDRAVPSVGEGSWPDDPPFTKITEEDTDGSLRNASLSHLPPVGTVFYLVLDRGTSGNEGPAGHYGSHEPEPLP